jgi:hypothetical protein
MLVVSSMVLMLWAGIQTWTTASIKKVVTCCPTQARSFQRLCGPTERYDSDEDEDEDEREDERVRLRYYWLACGGVANEEVRMLWNLSHSKFRSNNSPPEQMAEDPTDTINSSCSHHCWRAEVRVKAANYVHLYAKDSGLAGQEERRVREGMLLLCMAFSVSPVWDCCNYLIVVLARGEGLP